MLQSRRINHSGHTRVALYPGSCETPTDQLFESPGEWIEADETDAISLEGHR